MRLITIVDVNHNQHAPCVPKGFNLSYWIVNQLVWQLSSLFLPKVQVRKTDPRCVQEYRFLHNSSWPHLSRGILALLNCKPLHDYYASSCSNVRKLTRKMVNSKFSSIFDKCPSSYICCTNRPFPEPWHAVQMQLQSAYSVELEIAMMDNCWE